ncbi:MAG: hypothetical protein N2422_06575 [Rhodobacteraceae bacterium]|nr:hypothetical protein [Paracoccaceae bacterium]
MPTGPTIAFLVETRAPGGTAASVAEDLRALEGHVALRLHALGASMFRGRPPAPALDPWARVLRPAGGTVGADVVVMHNPSFLRQDEAPPCRIVTPHLVVVAHENFLLPDGTEAFDVGRCLGGLARASLAGRRSIAPVSPGNRRTVTAWLARNPGFAGWDVLGEDWAAIFPGPFLAPSARPADRRGRMSRPGPEKFPDLATLDLVFPATAASNVIMGGEPLAAAARRRPHWRILPFRSLDHRTFFGLIDFFVYFTAPRLRESLGRVLGEAVAAGKVAITDPATAENLGGAAIGADPREVEGLVRGLLADPAAYGERVRAGQAALARRSAAAFRDRVLPMLGPAAPPPPRHRLPA